MIRLILLPIIVAVGWTVHVQKHDHNGLSDAAHESGLSDEMMGTDPKRVKTRTTCYCGGRVCCYPGSEIEGSDMDASQWRNWLSSDLKVRTVKFGFGGCVAAHDECMWVICGRDKKECDDALKPCLINRCLANEGEVTSGNNTMDFSCKLYAGIYHIAASSFGGCLRFEDAQKSRCQCEWIF